MAIEPKNNITTVTPPAIHGDKKDKDSVEFFNYDNKIVKYFTIATAFWGLAGMLIGLIVAIQLFLPEANMGTPYTTYGRIRPLHTNAVIFAFVGNAIFMGVE